MKLIFRPYSKTSFGLSLGLTVFYLSLLVIIPLSALFFKSATLGVSGLWEVFSEERIKQALYLSFGAGGVAAIINLFVGFLFAWVLVRYDFPGKKILDSLVDLPFTLPTAVAGIALTTIYAPNGFIGKYLTPYGIKIAYTPIGIVIALVFIGFPFVVRTVQPILEDLPKELEESAYCLGASRFQTFTKVILPELIPSLLAGTSMAFARGIGEYGSVVFISGNLPGKTEILPLLIVTKLEQYEYAKATGIAVLMLVLSFTIMFGINYLQNRASRRLG
ncbi:MULTISPECIES: sulfate ABC transporter permease subunit CysT [Leptospira]|uniref:Sulfate transport system permease protein CysT n=2 Tax=Leptospira TaxID=171 RepID=A0A4R9FR86_9LEPT|nr:MULTISPECIES: sulfate ABC transporter permease subunit CysT [Leptospira]PKA15438.1 sulfate ABC transporter permease subunit CysT [Leptospira haakeii]PKA18341.1 sulfate ABC transporter permease subunit CysT [Leptospira haakeii]TGK00357.1 sulfate ABC transporter permease subunit CysT [Leptospira selangorensis]TGM17114.1 sulfate ABC transporter permease subunit CysT [Leptospira selangorensis]TGM21452.1 sulfate ABC transporter permease subunit CysT [Leptospira selangorensis]